MGKGDKKSKKGKTFRHSYGKSRLRKKQLRKKLRYKASIKSTTSAEKSQQPSVSAGKPPLVVETKHEIRPPTETHIKDVKVKETVPTTEAATVAEVVKKVESVSEPEAKQEKKASAGTGQKGRPRKKKEE